MKNPSPCLLIAFALFSFSKTFAQQNKLDIGIIGGPNRTKLVGNNLIEKTYRPRTLFTIGASAQYNFRKIISIYSGLQYEIKGNAAHTKLTDASGHISNDYTVKRSFHYTILPLLVKASFGKKYKVFFGAGTYAAYLVYIEDPSSPFPFQKSAYHPLDYGLLMNLGFGAPLSKKISITLEARNNIGLYNIYAHPSRLNEKLKTRSINLLVGLSYKLGSREN